MQAGSAEAPRARRLAGLLLALADRRGVTLPPSLALLHRWGPPEEAATCDLDDPDLLSKADARSQGRDTQRRDGVFHTPWTVAVDVAGAVVRAGDVVCDPACGTGTLLLAAVEAGAGELVACDLDPVAVAVTEARLALHGHRVRTVVGDGLALEERFDAVVANPPFVDGRHVRFLAWAASHAARTAMVLPTSTLATDEGATARAAAPIERVWRLGPVFDAAVDTCVVVLGPDGDRVTPWSAHLHADVPEVQLDGPPLGGWCDVVNGFRRHFYGLRGAVHEGGDGAPLVTAGAIHPGHWGGPVTFDRTRYLDARVDVAAIDPGVRTHYESLLRPKVVVATQTRVLEAAPDPEGVVVPGVPVLSVVPADPARLWHVLAVLLAPPVTAHALRTWGGAALVADAVKLSVSQVRALPCPRRDEEWSAAAALLREGGSVIEAGRLMCAAYEVGEEVHAWWAARLR
jgi:hypothetical protein